MTTPFEKKHHDIVQAAIAVFLEKGFELTSMDAVASKAGLSKVTVYNHFHDKKELFENVMVVHCSQLSNNKKLIEFDKNKSPKHLMENYAHRMVELLLHEQSIALMRVVIGEASRFPELAQSIWPEGKLPMQEELSCYLHREHDAQRLRIPHIALATKQFFGLIKETLVWPALMGLRIDNSPAHRQQVIEEAVSMFLSFYRFDGLIA